MGANDVASYLIGSIAPVLGGLLLGWFAIGRHFTKKEGARGVAANTVPPRAG